MAAKTETGFVHWRAQPGSISVNDTVFSDPLVSQVTLLLLQGYKNIYLPVTECAQEFVLVTFHSLQCAYKLRQ